MHSSFKWSQNEGKHMNRNTRRRRSTVMLQAKRIQWSDRKVWDGQEVVNISSGDQPDTSTYSCLLSDTLFQLINYVSWKEKEREREQEIDSDERRWNVCLRQLHTSECHTGSVKRSFRYTHLTHVWIWFAELRSKAQQYAPNRVWNGQSCFPEKERGIQWQEVTLSLFRIRLPFTAEKRNPTNGWQLDLE